MKTLISYVALTVFVLASSFTIDVQQSLNQQSNKPNDCFSYFRAHRQGKLGVAMTWAVSTPDVVQFVIERSYDDYYYEPIGSVDFNGASSYKFMDSTPYPGTGIYRIRAVKADGSTECSPIEKVRIIQRG